MNHHRILLRTEWVSAWEGGSFISYLYHSLFFFSFFLFVARSFTIFLRKIFFKKEVIASQLSQSLFFLFFFQKKKFKEFLFSYLIVANGFFLGEKVSPFFLRKVFWIKEYFVTNSLFFLIIIRKKRIKLLKIRQNCHNCLQNKPKTKKEKKIVYVANFLHLAKKKIRHVSIDCSSKVARI